MAAGLLLGCDEAALSNPCAQPGLEVRLNGSAHIPPMTCWEAVLVGGGHVPPVLSSAAAEAMFLLNDVGDSLIYTIVLSTLPTTTITSATLHRGAPADSTASTATVAIALCGIRGSVPGSVPACANLTAPGILIQASVPITAAQINIMRTFGFYSNVSTAGQPTGEIRGQVRNVDFFAP